MYTPNWTTLLIKIDRDKRDIFRKLAKERNRTMALLVRDFVDDYISKNTNEEQK